MRGRALTVQGERDTARAFLHVDDAVRGLVRVLEAGTPGEVYNLGSAEPPYGVREVARRVLAAVGKGEREPGEDPATPAIVVVADRPCNDQVYVVDSAKLRGLGWRPEVSFDDGFADTARWYVEALRTNVWPEIDRILDETELRQKGEDILHDQIDLPEDKEKF
ncbi:unnamed protein product [Phytomonas sp. Hart1]|nr:unnamed protein product [Phytomonas sp. Hart1]|eukprot:CCW70730.1 unnamed protein product [Phytomonas sp. isolate Hart1]